MAPTLDAYFLKIEKLCADLKNAVNDSKKIEMLNSFSKDYLLLPDLWKLRMMSPFRLGMNNSFPKKVSKLIKRALFDFYSDTLYYENEEYGHFTSIFQKMEEPFNRILNWNDLKRVVEYCAFLDMEANRKIIVEYISFPHSKLDEILFYVKMFLCEPMSKELKQTFQNSKALYEKIMAANDDIVEWFKFVLSTNDNRFIIQNVECRIAKEPENFQLWKMYIEYLGGKKYKAMLQVVYRYKRLYIDDNTFDLKINSTFEKLASLQYFQSAKFFKLKVFEKSVKKAAIISCPCYYTFPTIHQIFPFPSPMIRYITKKAQSDVLQSLYKSCKYFFDKRRQPLCYYVSIWCPREMGIKYYKNRMDIKNTNSIQLQNVCLTGVLDWFSAPTPEIISKLSESRLRYIRIHMGKLSISEYNFLTKFGEVEYFYVLFTKITVDGKENSEPIFLEDLLKNLPKAKYLHFHIDTKNTTKTTENVLNLKRTNKFNCFKISVNRFALDAKSYVQFIEKNVNPFASIELTLKGVTAEEREEFEKEVEAELVLHDNHENFKPWIMYMQN